MGQFFRILSSIPLLHTSPNFEVPAMTFRSSQIHMLTSLIRQLKINTLRSEIASVSRKIQRLQTEPASRSRNSKILLLEKQRVPKKEKLAKLIEILLFTVKNLEQSSIPKGRGPAVTQDLIVPSYVKANDYGN